jgi:hypothetical protein
MNIEEKLRGALATSAPPPTTTLDHVLKRGRRRVFAQRVGATLGVVAVVAGIGFGSTALNHAAPDSTPADQVNRGPAVVDNEVGWPRVDVAPQIPYEMWSPEATAPPPAGWKVLQLPKCVVQMPKLTPKQQAGTVTVNREFVQKWAGTVRAQLPEMKVSDLRSTELEGTYEYAVELTDGGGTGGVKLTVGRFAGITPQQLADDDLWATGDCEPPYRKVLEDGTVIQLHGVRASEPFRSLGQVMSVFRPDGTQLKLEQRNWSGLDLRVIPGLGGQTERVGPGRATLPLTDEQFSRLGPAIAEVA